MTAVSLTTLTKVKRFLRIDPATLDDDALLTDEIKAQSAWFLNRVGRDIVRGTYSEVFAGDDQRVRVRQGVSPWPMDWLRIGGRGYALNLTQTPVISIASVTIDGDAIPVRPDLTSNGYVLADPTIGRLVLVGYAFTPGTENVTIVYDAGFTVTAEPGTIPGSPFTIQSQLPFFADRGVTFTIGGAALTKVAGSPAASQYSVSSDGLYTFAAADTGKSVLINYDNVPADVDRAVIEQVAWVYKLGSRLGQKSRSGGQESVQFDMGDCSAFTQTVIDMYARRNI